MAFLTIDRALINPDWDAKTKLLFLWLCEEASVSRHEWHGVAVEAGQYLTTLRELAELFNLSYEGIRKKLKIISDFQSVTLQTIKVSRAKLGCQNMTLITINFQSEALTNRLPNRLTNSSQVNTSNTASYDSYQIQTLTNGLTADLTTKANIMSTNTPPPPPPTHASARTHEGGAEGGIRPIGEDDIPTVLAETLDKDVPSAALLWRRTQKGPKAAAAYFEDFKADCEVLGKTQHGNPRQLVNHFANWLSVRLDIERRKQQDKAAQAAKMERYADNKERTRSAIERNNDILDAMLRAAGGVGTDGGDAPLIPDY